MKRSYRVWPAIALFAFVSVPTRTQAADRLTVTVPALKVRVAPIVDVDTSPLFSVTARSWPGRATATLRFLSAHHGFTGSMLWDVRCHCFRLSVSIAKRIHPLEHATAWATLLFARGSAGTSTPFQIRGLRPGGRLYSPGGKPYLSGWVSNDMPSHAEQEHFCAWVHASDAFGMSGIRVTVVVHYPDKTQKLSAGKTNINGVACSHKTIQASPAGLAVPVDIFADGLHTRVAFRPRS